MKKILLDTSILIDFIRRGNKESTLLVSFTKEGYRLYVSILTHTEVYAGRSVWEKTAVRQEAEKLFSGMEIIPLEKDISIKAGEIKAFYATTLADAVIAATAFVYDIELATLNVKDFEKIKGIRLFTHLRN